MSVAPTVLYPLKLPGLLHYILTQAGTTSTTLIICSSRDAFLHHLGQSLPEDHGEGQDDYMQNMVSPSLHNLLTTRRVKLAFCASVHALLAYLTVCGQRGPTYDVEPRGKKRIVLVNPLALHASTLSFSGQGLSRSFAAATETAHKLGALLHIVECPFHGRETEQRAEDIDMENGEEEIHVDTNPNEDPWEQEVSILNVSARRFGSNSSERAWAGRTVKAKRIAARWFRFQQVDNLRTREGPE